MGLMPRLYCGDCLEEMRRIETGSVDMILTDLPYGTTANKWDACIPFDAMWKQFLRVTKPTAAIVLTASQPFTSALVMSQPKLFRYEWIWKKNIGSNFLQAKIAPMKEHESVLVFSRGKWAYFPILEERSERGKANVGKVWRSASTSGNYGTVAKSLTPLAENRIPSSVQAFKVQRDRIHPTQKPVDLMRYFIHTYTRAGETVLDATMGSGTTGVATVTENREFIGIELDPKYFAIAAARIIDTLIKM